MVTFLIAGHETTSGVLSFAIYALLENPAVLKKAQELVDEVLGDAKPTFEHLSKLSYLNQILKETLRIWPTAPVIGLTPYEDTVIGGKYLIRKDDAVILLLPSLHLSKSIWGEDVEAFDPERFSELNIKNIPANAYKPFGNGERACIGRPFALQEAQLILAMILQRFDLQRDNDLYKLKIKETLTLKPEDFYIKVKKRIKCELKQPTSLSKESIFNEIRSMPEDKMSHTPLLVLYGSNGGSSYEFAKRIVSDAILYGYDAKIATLNSYIGLLSKDCPVIIVASSYEGKPTHDAYDFVLWLENLQSNTLQDIKYCVFGCGNSDWLKTYQAVPKYIDEKLNQAGAVRFLKRGETDAKNDFFDGFEHWYLDIWSSLGLLLGKEVSVVKNSIHYKVEILNRIRQDIHENRLLTYATVIDNYELVNRNSLYSKSKRHIELLLPQDTNYRAGDYLSVLPVNGIDKVTQLLRRFNYDNDTEIIIHSSIRSSHLPINQPITVTKILSNYIELNNIITQKQLSDLVKWTKCPPEKKQISRLVADDLYKSEVLIKRFSLCDILYLFPSCDLPFNLFLEMLPPIRARQYSISSSSLWNPTHCTLTVSVVNSPALSGVGNYSGTASNYLTNCRIGDKILVSVIPSHEAFHLPKDLTIPIIMIAAGTGLAPFRGFLQERSILKKTGHFLGNALLFFGCNSDNLDFIYKDELLQFENDGIVDIRTAFSSSQEDDLRYVQDRVWKDRNDVINLFNNGAIIYVCGDGRYMAKAVRATIIKIYREYAKVDDNVAEEWEYQIEHIEKRYITDIFDS